MVGVNAPEPWNVGAFIAIADGNKKGLASRFAVLRDIALSGGYKGHSLAPFVQASFKRFPFVEVVFLMGLQWRRRDRLYTLEAIRQGVLGAPGADRLHYASKLADRTTVYTHRDPEKVIADPDGNLIDVFNPVTPEARTRFGR